jgi:hypothetical protein
MASLRSLTEAMTAIEISRVCPARFQVALGDDEGTDIRTVMGAGYRLANSASGMSAVQVPGKVSGAIYLQLGEGYLPGSAGAEKVGAGGMGGGA